MLNKEMSSTNESLTSPSSLNPRQINHIIENSRLYQGLAITGSTKQDKAPSIPYEPRKEETQTRVGPASYDPNYDILHKNAPTVTSVSK